MIDRVSGTIIEKDPTHVVVSVGGIGLHLSISLQTFERIGISKEVTLFTYLNVREDLLQLFGFAEREEREAFKMLISVNGVGPRVGQAILSSLSVSNLRDAVVAGDFKRLTVAPGVGKKLAERMVVELRDKFGAVEVGDISEPGYSGDSGVVYEAASALMALGHSQGQAEKLISRAAKKVDGELTVESLLKLALRNG